MSEFKEHAGQRYAVLHHYAIHDDAWRIELSMARPVPVVWADIPGAVSYLHGSAIVVAMVPDEDPALEPTVHIHSDDEHVIPYEIMRWFMELVGNQVEGCRAALTAEAAELS
jgi:hypothetical protein